MERALDWARGEESTYNQNKAIRDPVKPMCHLTIDSRISRLMAWTGNLTHSLPLTNSLSSPLLCPNQVQSRTSCNNPVVYHIFTYFYALIRGKF
jgi:hypothetical protein